MSEGKNTKSKHFLQKINAIWQKNDIFDSFQQMGKIRQYGIILTVSAVLLACKKDSGIILGDGETPAQEMSKAVPYIDNVEDSYSFEIGFVFVSAKNGRVTQLGGRLAQQGVSKVSLWDFDTQQKLVEHFTKRACSGSSLKQHTCPVCEAQFDGKDDLLLHISGNFLFYIFLFHKGCLKYFR